MRQIDLIKLYGQMRCLVVDDMPDVRVAIMGMLRVFGVQQIDVVANGEQAMDACLNNHYHMVLCDYNLGPGRDGQQVLEELRYRNRLNNTSIFVMITAESSREMVLGAMRQRRLANLAKLNEDSETCLAASRRVIKTARNSVYESSEDYFNLARELADLSKDGENNADKYVKETFEVLQRLEKRPYFDVSADVQSNSLKSRSLLNNNKLNDAEIFLDKAKTL